MKKCRDIWPNQRKFCTNWWSNFEKIAGVLLRGHNPLKEPSNWAHEAGISQVSGESDCYLLKRDYSCLLGCLLQLRSINSSGDRPSLDLFMYGPYDFYSSQQSLVSVIQDSFLSLFKCYSYFNILSRIFILTSLRFFAFISILKPLKHILYLCTIFIIYLWHNCLSFLFLNLQASHLSYFSSSAISKTSFLFFPLFSFFFSTKIRSCENMVKNYKYMLCMLYIRDYRKIHWLSLFPN